jgi:hypothetical protein
VHASYAVSVDAKLCSDFVSLPPPIEDRFAPRPPLVKKAENHVSGENKFFRVTKCDSEGEATTGCCVEAISLLKLIRLQGYNMESVEVARRPLRFRDCEFTWIN